MTKPTDNPSAAGGAFEREERFIVIKRKHLTNGHESAIRALLEDIGVDTVECVVVESDWPEYETVWQMIEDRVTGRQQAIAQHGGLDRPALLAAARYWWAQNMDSHCYNIVIGGDGRVKVYWRDADESGRYTLPVDFAASRDTDERAEKSQHEGGRGEP